MRWGIVTAAVIAVARSLWLSLIVDRTISSIAGGRCAPDSLLPCPQFVALCRPRAFAAEGASRSSSAIRATSMRLHSTIRSTTSRQ